MEHIRVLAFPLTIDGLVTQPGICAAFEHKSTRFIGQFFYCKNSAIKEILNAMDLISK
jgi:hypothetical protein